MDILNRGAKIDLKFCQVPYTELPQDANSPSFIVMDNLSYDGFKEPKNKKDGLTFEYCNLVMEELAKFHTTGYVYLNHSFKGGLNEGLEKNAMYCRYQFKSKCVDAAIDG